MPALAGRTPPQKLNTTCFSTKSLSVVGPMLPAETPPRVAGWADILITCQAEAALFHERNAEQRNPLIMVCASGAMAVRILVFSTRLITWLRRRALGSLVTAKASRLGN